MRLLKLDPRPPAYDSVAAATRDDDESTTMLDDAFEMADWRPIAPAECADEPSPRLAFVDGVQQYDARFSAEGDGWPIPGVLATYAAGAMCPGSDDPLCHVTVQRAAILTRGARPAAIDVRTSKTLHRYHPESAAGDDPAALESKLNQLRAEVEASIVRRLLGERFGLVIVDGRLPQQASGAVGLIKTPQRVPVTSETQINVLRGLRRGERSPVFVRRRSDRRYYSWFTCLASPGRYDLAMSGLAMMEMDDSASREEVTRAADLTASALPRYAPKPHRDPRAPQNLLPVGQLERDLRRRMGQREFVARLIRESFAREDFAWTF
ncbi:MAG: hypothetical protein WEB52_02915 [Dehalococcoidia bacterium]